MKETPIQQAFGNSPKAAILNFLHAHVGYDYHMSEIGKHVGISRQTVAKSLPDLMYYNLVKASRVIGNTTMYKFNMNSQQGIKFHNLNKVLVDIVIADEEGVDPSVITSQEFQ